MMSGIENWKFQPLPQGIKEFTQSSSEHGLQEISYWTYCMDCSAQKYHVHVILVRLNDHNALEMYWEHITDKCAYQIQGVIEDEIEQSNLYLCFFLNSSLNNDELRKKIENDRFSSKKYIFDETQKWTTEECLKAVKNKLFTLHYSLKNDQEPHYLEEVNLKDFRCYKGIHPFSFIRNDGKAARLVVIYAENGAGKTSFFDGIEWGTCGFVDRLNNYIPDKKYKGKILRNRESIDDKAYVEIVFDGNRRGKRYIAKINGLTKQDTGMGRVSSSTDELICYYKQNNLKQAQEAWQFLMMQHHKIDGFISACTSKDHFDEWVGLWDVTGERREEMKTVNEKHNFYKIAFDSEAKKYETAKQNLQNLKEGSEQLSLLKRQQVNYFEAFPDSKLPRINVEECTFKKYQSWTNQTGLYEQTVKTALNRCKEQIEQLKSLLEHGLTEIDNNMSAYSKMVLTSISMKNVLDQTIHKRQLEEQRIAAEKVLKNSNKEIGPYNTLISQLGCEKYIQAKLYIENQKYQATCTDDIDKLRSQVAILQNEVDNINAEQKKIKQELESKKTLEKIRENHKQLQVFSGELSALDEKYKLTDKAFEETQTLLKRITAQQLELTLEITEMENGIIDTRPELLKVVSKEERDALSKAQKEFQKALMLRNQLEHELNLAIKTEETMTSLRNQIKTIVSNKQLTECPICHTAFDSFDNLLQRIYIANGNSTTESKKLSEAEVSVNDQKINLIDKFTACKNTLAQMSAAISDDVGNTTRILSQQKEKRETLATQINEKTNKIVRISNNNTFDGLTVIYSEEGILHWLESSKQQKKQRISDLESLALQKMQNIVELNQITDNLKHSLEEKHRQSDNLRSFLAQEIPLVQSNQSIIQKYDYNEIAERYADIQKKQKHFLQLLSEIKQELEQIANVDVTQETVLRQGLENITNEAENAQLQLNKHKQLWLQKTGLDKLSEEAAKLQIKIVKDNMKSLELEQKLLLQLQYNREIYDYFYHHNELEEHARNSKAALRTAEQTFQKVDAEFNSKKQSMETELNEFFKELNVNEIFSKIEPHKNLTQISFHVVYGENDIKPSLQIIATDPSMQDNKSDDNEYRPEWFFSSAQLNVLAFCIFFARALNSKNPPVNTIFIDDPIGHFDDMNILAFVDLLRILLEQTPWQIIMSTHDLETYELLQRKLPEKYYYTKYIQL